MFMFCSNCAIEDRTDSQGEWKSPCKFCFHNPEIGISEYDSMWVSQNIQHPDVGEKVVTGKSDTLKSENGE